MFHKRVLRTGLVVGLMAISAQVLAVPEAISAVYNVYRNNTPVGYLESRLQYAGGGYEYSKSTRATGIARLLTKARVTEKSTGKAAGHRLIPLSYLYDERTRSKTRIEQARFVNGQVSGIYKDKAYSLAVPANVLDRATLELAVARDLKRALPHLVYQVMERGKIKTYTFVRQGSERLRTAAGEFDTIKVAVKRSDNSHETIYWMARQLDYLPVKMFHREKGDVITTDLNSYRRGG
ncbi:MAG: hypothetical protein CSB47_06695 [Proteobacteria bacterium]|nr:MAG: hypothetical protein CSB47_06695 [Pseudomonadota bacterium]